MTLEGSSTLSSTTITATAPNLLALKALVENAHFPLFVNKMKGISDFSGFPVNLSSSQASSGLAVSILPTIVCPYGMVPKEAKPDVMSKFVREI